MIEIKGLSKYYGKFGAVKNLEANIRHGELVGFIGPNGAGKTTTFKCLSTLAKPSGGQILIDGMDVCTRACEIRKITGYLPEENPLINELSVYEYLKFRHRLKGGSGRSPSGCIDICGLGNYAGRVISKLSKGLRQRIGIAEALLCTPKILLLDEPINGLDPEQIINIRNLLVSLKNDHTIIVSSHILSELELICDKYLIISRGCRKSFGTRDEILSASSQKPELHIEISPGSAQFLQKLELIDKTIHPEYSGSDPQSITLKLDKNLPDPRAFINYLARDMNVTILKLDIKLPGLEKLYMELTGE